jgi:hypothetical protein
MACGLSFGLGRKEAPDCWVYAAQNRTVAPSKIQTLGAALWVDSRASSASYFRRHDAFEQSVPHIGVDSKNRLTAERATETEQAFIDDDLVRLPETLRGLLRTLLSSLQNSNAPNVIKSTLGNYYDELNLNGASARIPDLEMNIRIILAEISDSQDSPWLRGGLKVSLQEFLSAHEKFRLNFPLMVLRDIKIARANIDQTKFDDEQFAKNSQAILTAVKRAVQDDIAEQEIERIVVRREQQRKDILSLGSIVPRSAEKFLQNVDEVSVDDVKKRFLFDQSGLFDRMLDRAQKVTEIADTTAGKGLIGAATAFVKWLWS